tara:strand:+ start:372 stop:494 length:123 start_codon:yes stop_codon:yes gene_type:complete
MNKGPPNKFGKTKQLKRKSTTNDRQSKKQKIVPWPLAATR